MFYGKISLTKNTRIADLLILVASSMKGIEYATLQLVKGADTMDGKSRANIKIDALVDIVLKKDQRTGKLTRGHVKRILTNSSQHPHGIKVMLKEGDQVGRVQKIITDDKN